MTLLRDATLLAQDVTYPKHVNGIKGTTPLLTELNFDLEHGNGACLQGLVACNAPHTLPFHSYMLINNQRLLTDTFRVAVVDIMHVLHNMTKFLAASFKTKRVPAFIVKPTVTTLRACVVCGYDHMARVRSIEMNRV